MESIPYDKRSGKIWFNGKTVNWEDANVHILNHGLHYASCVFEGERVYDGEIFKLEEHTERLFYSAKRMGILVPYTQIQINDACRKIVNVQKVQNMLIMITPAKNPNSKGNDIDCSFQADPASESGESLKD